jgi:hypothetical protein
MIWEGFIPISPVSVQTFIVNAQLPPHTSKSLKFFFNKNIKVNGTEKIMISFVENGCPVDVSGY